jgi:hypothetical protein
MRITATIAQVQHPTMRLVFSGGTSLSKAYGLIQRFSEDLDFKVAMAEGLSRKDFREYREGIVEAIRRGSEDWSLSQNDVQSLNSSRFFKCEIVYRQFFQRTSALRPHIKLEVTFDPPALPFEERSLQSFVAQARQQEPEVIAMPCISPVETAADKMSAMAWRVATRDRSSPQDDVALVRHLYDLAALEETITQFHEFVPLVMKCLAKDASRSKTSGVEISSEPEQLHRMLNTLENDPLYAMEYERFVLGMSYATDSKRPSFQESLRILTRLVKLFGD